MPACSALEINSRGSAGTNLQIDCLALRAHGHSPEASPPAAQGHHLPTSLLKCVCMFSF